MTTCEHEVGQRTCLTKCFKMVPLSSLTSSLCSPILPMTAPCKLLRYQCVVILLLPFKVHLNRPFAVWNTDIGPIWVKNVASHRFCFFLDIKHFKVSRASHLSPAVWNTIHLSVLLFSDTLNADTSLLFGFLPATILESWNFSEINKHPLKLYGQVSTGKQSKVVLLHILKGVKHSVTRWQHALQGADVESTNRSVITKAQLEYSKWPDDFIQLSKSVSLSCLEEESVPPFSTWGNLSNCSVCLWVIFSLFARFIEPSNERAVTVTKMTESCL